MRGSKNTHIGRGLKQTRLKIKRKSKTQQAVTASAKQRPKKLTFRIPKTPKQYSEMSETAKENWSRAAQVISKMRSDRTSLAKAAKEFSVKPAMVRDLVKSALKKQKN